VVIPSIHRYMALGLLLPALVFIGMLSGYNYGQAYSDFSAALFATVGSIAGLIISTIIIVKVALFWDRRILLQSKKRKARRSK
jgi:hypothetical protein